MIMMEQYPLARMRTAITILKKLIGTPHQKFCNVLFLQHGLPFAQATPTAPPKDMTVANKKDKGHQTHGNTTACSFPSRSLMSWKYITIPILTLDPNPGITTQLHHESTLSGRPAVIHEEEVITILSRPFKDG